MSQKRHSPAIISPRVHDCQTPGTSSSRELPWGLVPQRLKLPQDNSCLAGIFAAQALIQSKITDPGQVFLLLFFVFCLFYLLKSPHVSAMKCFQQLHDQRGIAIDTCPDKSSTSVSSLVSSLGDLGDLGHGTLEESLPAVLQVLERASVSGELTGNACFLLHTDKMKGAQARPRNLVTSASRWFWWRSLQVMLTAE